MKGSLNVKTTTKAQLKKKYDDAKHEILRLHEICASQQQKLDTASAGLAQLRRGTDAVLTGIVLAYGKDSGSGRELSIPAGNAESTLRAWALTVSRTEDGLRLYTKPRAGADQSGEGAEA